MKSAKDKAAEVCRKLNPLPQKIRLKEMCTAICLPPGISVLPTGAIGNLSEVHGMYFFDYYPGYTSAITVKFVLISDKFEEIES